MTRIVVQVAWRPEPDSKAAPEDLDGKWAELLGSLYERAMALGGRVIGWSPNELAVDFAWDGLYDAVDFLVDAPIAPKLCAAMCLGRSEVILDNGRIAMVVGAPVRAAAQLVKMARPGEVLLSADLVAEGEGRFGILEQAGPRPGSTDVHAFVLDPANPLTQVDEEPPSSVAFGPGPAGPQPSISSRAPASVVARHVERLASTAAVLDDTEAAVFPRELASALKKRDAESLQELARSIRSHGGNAAERMEAIAELAGGKAGEALRRLRRSKEQADRADPSARCRAALALAVALMAAGRPYEAALEGLDGVARAREGEDQRGERACARFLAQLASSMGDEASSQAWAGLGQ